MCIIKNVDGSTNTLLNELNFVVNSDEYGFNQEDSYIDWIYEKCLKNKSIFLTTNDIENLWTLMRTFCSFDRNKMLDRQAVRSLFQFWNKSTNTYAQTILKALCTTNPNSSCVIKVSYLNTLNSFLYTFECYNSDYLMFISPTPKSDFFIDGGSKVLFGFFFNDETVAKKFMKIHNVKEFIKQHKSSISLLYHRE